MSAKKSEEFASIDESPVKSRSIDTDLARRNLKKLQDHVNKQFSNVPCVSAANNVERGGGQLYPLPPGRHLIERLPSNTSIKDDDLFRGESDSEHGDNVSNVNDLEGVSSEVNTGGCQVLYSRTDTNKSDDSAEARNDITDESLNLSGGATANLPNFGEIGFRTSRSSISSEINNEYKTLENTVTLSDSESKYIKAEHEDEVENVALNKQEIFDFKTQYRSKRSLSDIKEKRRRFSQRDFDIVEEVFEEEYLTPVRKSNSLPDLILSSSSSSLSPKSISDRKSPDVILGPNDDGIDLENQSDRKALKDSFEGRSSFDKHEGFDIGVKKKKASFCRSVSFSDTTDCRYYESNEYDNIEKSIEDGCIDSRTDRNSQAEEKDNQECPKSPAAESRRQLFSKSSGYQTGSNNSRESHDNQYGSFQSDAFHDGYDLEKQTVHDRNVNGTIEEADNFNSGTNTSNSSNDTLLEAVIEDSVKYQKNRKEEMSNKENEQVSVEGPSPELPFLSIMERSPLSSLNNYRIESQVTLATGSDSFSNIRSGDQSDNAKVDDNLLMKPLQCAHSFKRSQSTLGQSPSMQGSLGNVPKLGLLDDSVVLGPSLLAAVNEEDRKMEEQVRKKYTATAGSLAHIDEEGATGMAGRSLSSYLNPTNSLMVQAFEDIVQKHPNDPEQIKIAYNRLLASESSSPGHSPFDFGDGAHGSSPKNKLFTVDELEKASRCMDPKCFEPACEKEHYQSVKRFVSRSGLTFHWSRSGYKLFTKIQRVTVWLKVDVDVKDNLVLSHYLESVLEHSQDCEELVCPVLYCQKCSEWCPDGNDTKILYREIKGYLRNPLRYLEQKTEPKFTRLHDSIGDAVPQKFVTFFPLSVLPQSGKAVLAQDLQTERLCIIKEYPLFEDSHQLKVLSALRGLNNPNIVSQFWLLEYTEENAIHICSDFMAGGSLLEYMGLVGQLPWLQAVHYLKQMTDAVCFLHSKRVVYLNWQSCNMLFPNTRRDVVKISDFAFSYCLDSRADVGALKQCLSANICPPEFLTSYILCEKSDSWGVGCLLEEMLSGTPIWYDLRHEDRESIHKQICSGRPYIDPTMPVDQRLVFECCWKINPEERSSIMKLNRFFGKILNR